MFRTIQKFLNIDTEVPQLKYTLFYILFAYFFAFATRLIMLYHMVPDAVVWQDNGVPVPILSPDTALYGYYAQEILSGHYYSIDTPDRLPAYMLAFVTFVFSANMDWVIFLLPVFLVSLTIIPIILIGNTLRLPKLGLFAALFAMADLNFFLRSHLSYYDTDVLNLFFPLMIIWAMMQVVLRQKQMYLLYGGLFFWLFGLWYHSSASISAALIFGFAATVFLFFRQNTLNFQAIFVFTAAVLPFYPILSFVAMLMVFLFFLWLNTRITTTPNPYILLLILGALAVLIVDPSHYYQRAMTYFDRPEMIALHGKETTYYFLNQLTNVAEAIQTNIVQPFGFFNRQSSLVVLSTMGFILGLIVFRGMFFLLPLFILGYSSSLTGGRFMMYATPALAFGMAFLILFVFDKWKHVSRLNLPLASMRNITVAIILFYMTNIIYIASKNYNVVFRADEVTAIRHFSTQLTPNDTLLTWWDFGWPLWYYTGYANTMADNGEHGSYDSYAISRILMSDSQTFSANASLYFSQMQKEAHAHGIPYALEYLARKGVDLNVTLETLSQKSLGSPKPKGDVYILLRNDMYNKMYSIDRSSNFDITSGKFFHNKMTVMDTFKQKYLVDEPLAKGTLFTVDNVNGIALGAENQTVPLKAIAVSNQHKLYALRRYNHETPLSLLITKDVFAIYLDNALFNSFFIQAYMFDNYDRSRFEKVVETEYMKIFKVLPSPAE